MDSPPETLLEYERQQIQGRCLSIIGETIEQSFDVVLRTSEQRNELLNVLDLYLEWGKEELESSWDELRTVSKEDVVGGGEGGDMQETMVGCVTYADVKTRCPSLVSLADKLHDGFMRYVELRDDRLSSVCFDRECLALETSGGKDEELRKRNPWLLKAFVEVCETMISIKAYCEEGVFRIPGMRVLVTGYTTRIQQVCAVEKSER